MKRYEDFNRMFDNDDSVEIQALGMVIERIKEDNPGLDIGDGEYDDLFIAMFEWLNEEVEDEIQSRG